MFIDKQNCVLHLSLTSYSTFVIFCLHVVYFVYRLLFTDKQDCVFWKMAIEEAIADALGDNTVSY